MSVKRSPSRKFALALMTDEERKNHVRPFECAAWRARVARNQKRQDMIRAAALARKEAKKVARLKAAKAK